jgi:hypothetical protein
MRLFVAGVACPLVLLLLVVPLFFLLVESVAMQDSKIGITDW